MKQFGYDIENCITPDRVAEVMAELISDGKYGGGTCLETSASGERVIGTWNIDPPAFKGTAVPQEVIDRNRAPILAKLNKERTV